MALHDRLRRRAGAFVVDNLFRGLARLGQLHPAARPHKHGVTIDRDLDYVGDGDGDHRLDVWRPIERRRSSAEPAAVDPGRSAPSPIADGTATARPAILYIHGGGFRILSKDSHWVMALAFARRGYVVFNINYRLGPRHPYPAALEDAAAAWRWVLANAARFGADPARLAVAGESAGANLAACLAIAACFRREEPFARPVFDAGVVPRAVLPACGLLQVSDPERFQRRRPVSPFVRDRLLEPYAAYLAASPATGSERELADPLCLLETDRAPDRPLPPFFAPVGTADPILDDTRRLKAALDRRGVRCETTYYPGELHAFHAFVFTKNARRCWRSTFEFLDGVMG